MSSPFAPSSKLATGPEAPPPPMSGVKGELGKEEVASSVLTSTDPTPEAACKANEVVPTETKSRNAEGDGGVDVVKEATVP